ncbi:hypothetical protein AKJ09_02452 [Labilithrix luteola]|uniref:DUF4136 domain-containing protein n=2 Tax=Labilithrix luteola TaxID=1391654 RepID=A0A0K1PQI9_9BACT|nr:hypothetical protein AKJ09_02452 [Labilithrix luteola]
MLVLAAACGSTMQVKSNEANKGADVARYHTYAQETAEQPPEGFARTDLTPDVTDIIFKTVDEELSRRGYAQAPPGTKPELLVRSSSGVRQVRRQPTGKAAVVGAPSVEETQSQLVIDIFDQSGKQLFHGYAQDEVQPGQVKEERVDQAVAKILAPVPMSSQAPASMTTTRPRQGTP